MHKVFSRSVETVVDVASFILEWTLVPIVFVLTKLAELFPDGGDE